MSGLVRLGRGRLVGRGRLALALVVALVVVAAGCDSDPHPPPAPPWDPTASLVRQRLGQRDVPRPDDDDLRRRLLRHGSAGVDVRFGDWQGVNGTSSYLQLTAFREVAQRPHPPRRRQSPGSAQRHGPPLRRRQRQRPGRHLHARSEHDRDPPRRRHGLLLRHRRRRPGPRHGHVHLRLSWRLTAGWACRQRPRLSFRRQGLLCGARRPSPLVQAPHDCYRIRAPVRALVRAAGCGLTPWPTLTEALGPSAGPLSAWGALFAA